MGRKRRLQIGEGLGCRSDEAFDIDSGTHHDEDVELTCLTEGEELFDEVLLLNKALVPAVDFVEKPLGGDTRYRLFACRINGQEDGAVGDGQR